MGTKLKNAPVYFTIGQVQHNPLLSLENFVPRIQESMRKAGYPGFKRATSIAFNLTQAANANAIDPPPQRVDQFLFSNSAETCLFILAPNALSFQTTNYHVYEDFWTELKRGLEILSDAVGGLSFVDRLGLRYLDAISPRDSESLSQYLVPQLLGLPHCMSSSTFQYNFSEALLVADIGKVTCRTIAQNGRIGFPPELSSHDLKLKERFLHVKGEHAILDTDGFSDSRRDYDLAGIEVQMNDLHELMASCFKAAVTPFAWKVWAGEEHSS